jgi:hypothetical protein
VDEASDAGFRSAPFLQHRKAHAVMRKENGRLVIEPTPSNNLLELLASWEPLEEEFPEIDDPPAEPFDL